MLEVKIFGGLGNQMFQYAFSRYLSIKNTDVKLNISDYNVHHHHHGFELNRVFDIECSFYEKESDLAFPVNNIFVRFLRKILKVEIMRRSEYYENKEISFVPLTNIYSNIYFVGFWQDVRYVDPVKDILLDEFSFKKIDDKNKKFLDEIADRETVAIHVRRGDYLKSTTLGNVCDENYYMNAINYINKHIFNPLFIFFSDDIKWCKNNFKNMDARFVDWNVGEDSYKDMQLMSLCKNNIIANSSFSWWGAYLNRKQNITICPKIWNNSYKMNRLICDKWIAL